MSERVKDKYDEAVEYLTEHPERIYHNWTEPFETRGGCLFMPAGISYDDEHFPRRPDGVECGCLTYVKRGICDAWTKDLTDEIRADTRLTGDETAITVESLPVFAEWQRTLDARLNRN